MNVIYLWFLPSKKSSALNFFKRPERSFLDIKENLFFIQLAIARTTAQCATQKQEDASAPPRASSGTSATSATWPIITTGTLQTDLVFTTSRSTTSSLLTSPRRMIDILLKSILRTVLRRATSMLILALPARSLRKWISLLKQVNNQEEIFG